MTREEFLACATETYAGTRSVLRAVPADKIDYCPREGMLSIAKLIRHIASACAGPFKFVLEGNFPPPTGKGPMTPASELKGYGSVDEALSHLDEDEKLLRSTVMGLSEEEFQTNQIQLPWAPVKVPVWHLGLMMTDHLSGHRMQLFQYLRILGEPVDTYTLYGM